MSDKLVKMLNGGVAMAECVEQAIEDLSKLEISAEFQAWDKSLKTDRYSELSAALKADNRFKNAINKIFATRASPEWRNARDRKAHALTLPITYKDRIAQVKAWEVARDNRAHTVVHDDTVMHVIDVNVKSELATACERPVWGMKPADCGLVTCMACLARITS